MLRIFLPLYVCIFIFVTFNETIRDVVVDTISPNAKFFDSMRSLTGTFIFLDEVLPNKQEEHWFAFLQKLSKNTNTNYILLPINTIEAPDEELKNLKSGNVWVNDQDIYKGFKGSNLISSVEPTHWFIESYPNLIIYILS